MKNKRSTNSCVQSRRNAMKAIVTVATIGASGSLQASLPLSPAKGFGGSGVKMARGWILRGSDS